MQLIDDPVGAQALAHRMAEAAHVAIDSESNSMHAHRERVCLIQVAVDDDLFVVDPFAFESSSESVAPYAELLADASRPLVLHGGEYDVAVFKREFDLSLRGVFDTQQAASFLGWKRTGLGSLVSEVCGVELTKAYAKHDWGRRPIAEEPLAYAVDDVRYLAKLRAHLEAAIVEADLVEEFEIACRAVEDAAAHDQSFNPAGFWKAKGVKELDDEARVRLQALWAWRENLARRLNRPSGRVINPQQLVAIARRPPRGRDGLSKTGLSGALRRHDGPALLECLKRVEESPPKLLPKPRNPRFDGTPAARNREKALKTWRRKEAEARDVPLGVVLPGRTIAWLAEDPDRDWSEAPQMGAKRLAMYESALRKCL